MRILELLLCFASITGLTIAMDVVHMDQWCGDSYNIGSYPATRIKLTGSSKYRANMDCTFTVKGDYIYEDQLMIQFQDLSVESACSNDYLAIFNGRDKSDLKIGGKKFCGYNTPSTVYTSSTSSLTFYFKSDGSVQGSGFDIILTHFRAGVCRSYEIDCNNGRCVDDSLRCNSHNPCGDHSDCYLTAGGIAGIAVGSVFFVVILVIIIVAIRRRRVYMYQRPVQPVTVATATIQAVAVPPPQGYNQPVPQQFQIPSAAGVYTGQTMTTYPPPPPYTPQY